MYKLQPQDKKKTIGRYILQITILSFSTHRFGHARSHYTNVNNKYGTANTNRHLYIYYTVIAYPGSFTQNSLVIFYY